MRWRALPTGHILAITALVLLSGCATVGQLSQERTERGTSAAGRITEGSETPGDRDGPDRAAALAELMPGLPVGLVPYRTGSEPVADWYTAMPASATPGTPESPALQAMGLFTGGSRLYLRVAGGEVVELADGADVLSVDPRTLVTDTASGSAPAPQLLAVSLAYDGREELLLAVPRLPVPYVLRIPVSAASRAQLRDLDGDGLAELLTTTVVFDAAGRRELVVDALGWGGTRFVHRESISLLRELNTALAELERRLERSADPAWRAEVSQALQPLDGAPPPATLLPARVAQVPEVRELSVDLDLAAWSIAHDLALDNNIYRIRIRIEANPLMDRPVRIAGLDEL